GSKTDETAKEAGLEAIPEEVAPDEEDEADQEGEGDDEIDDDDQELEDQEEDDEGGEDDNEDEYEVEEQEEEDEAPPSPAVEQPAKIRRTAAKGKASKPAEPLPARPEVHDRWAKGGDVRKALLAELEAADWNKDCFVSRVTKTSERVNTSTAHRKRGWYTVEGMSTILKWS
ncbi:unnamed protein product, partial [Symbiodinium necroappetens]